MPPMHRTIDVDSHLCIKYLLMFVFFYFEMYEYYLMRISSVGNDSVEPHFVSDHVVKSPNMNPVSALTAIPVHSDLNPEYHKSLSRMRTPITKPMIGPYQRRNQYSMDFNPSSHLNKHSPSTARRAYSLPASYINELSKFSLT